MTTKEQLIAALEALKEPELFSWKGRHGSIMELVHALPDGLSPRQQLAGQFLAAVATNHRVTEADITAAFNTADAVLNYKN